VIGAAGPTLETVQYEDTFRGGNIPVVNESVHFSMVFRHPERTLTGEEVERAVKSVVESCETRFRAELRT
jgi:phenylalanyl-tRNA synthetase beta chain